MKKLRFLIPNAITAVGIAFAAVALQRAIDGEYRTAAWWVMYCVLTDKLDGAAARRLRASSAFGAQLDSFADFFSFGVAPATVFYAFFSRTPDAGWTDGPHRALLSLLVLGYVICVAARLARFNVTVDALSGQRFFFGIPTTYTGGVLAALFVLVLKYGNPAWTAHDPSSDTWRLLDGLRLDGIAPWLPWLLAPAGFGMVSKLRMPKVGPTGRPAVDIVQLIAALAGYAVGLARRLPEYIVAGALVYLLVTFWYHLRSESARAVKPPPLFKSDDEHEPDRSALGDV